MAESSRVQRASTTETDVAVLQVEVTHIRGDVNELKSSVKSMHDAIDNNAKDTMSALKEMAESAEKAHSELNKKITSLEKWRWMMMGAGLALGYFGFDMISKLLQAH